MVQLWKLHCDGQLSSFNFNYHLRRYNKDGDFDPAAFASGIDVDIHTEAGRCKLTLD
jgi:hypothetical protein